MEWTPGGRSSDLEDRRGGGGGFIPFGGGGIGIGGVLLLLVLSLVFKHDFLSTVSGSPVSPTTTNTRPIDDPKEEPEVQFVSFVLDDAQQTWTTIFRNNGENYRHAKLVLFRDATQSGCGFAQSATGPFYCPVDERVYIDLGFYDELRERFGAPGDFAQAYVLAHEIGHHVQKLVGTESKMRQLQQQDPAMQNQLSVKLELQADCYAGVWAHSAEQRKKLDPGDLEEGIRAAGAVGDDRIQRMGHQRVNPDTFTHGSSDQRIHWFRQGFDTGDMRACNTFDQ